MITFSGNQEVAESFCTVFIVYSCATSVFSHCDDLNVF